MYERKKYINMKGKMKSRSVRNTSRNMIWGVVNRVIAFLISFAMRTVLIHILGSEYLGLDSLFTSILQMLNIAELGFSTAVVFSMYKPIALDNQDRVCELLRMYRTAYRIIGIVILTVGLLLSPILPLLIKGHIPSNLNLYILYFIFLGNTVIGYWMFAYKKSLLSAHQREDLNTNANTIFTLFKAILQLLVVIVFRNYYLYLLIMPLASLAENIYIEWLTRKLFPQYVCRGQLDRNSRRDIGRSISGLIIRKICQVSRNSMDNIIISAYLGLSQVTIYGNYYTILYGVHTLLKCITNGMTASVGNKIVVSDREKNHADMMRFTFMYMWVASICTVCLLVIFQPFMMLWMGEQLMLPDSAMILLCIYLYTLCIGDVRAVYITSTGLWWEGRYKSIAEAVTNIVLNIVLGKHFGIPGIILATVLSLLIIDFGYGTTIIYQHYFKNNKIFTYYLQHIFCAIVTVATAFIVYTVCQLLPEYECGLINILLKGAAAFLLANMCLLAAYHRTACFRDALRFVRNMVDF